MFLIKASTFLEELETYEPAMLAACVRAVSSMTVDLDFHRLGVEFLDAPSKSIDYAVMERTHRAGVVPLDVSWHELRRRSSPAIRCWRSSFVTISLHGFTV
jgi:mannose-1-phosphate guanylyltransferase